VLFSRYGYDHLILKIEWAKPSTKDASGAGSNGLSGGFVSGYGKALPQDVPKP
jgi:translation initiation factor 3 subunit G